MIKEDDNFVLEGRTPLEPLPNVTLGRFIYEHLRANKFQHDAMVDAFTGGKISYQSIHQQSCRLAESLRARGYDERSIFSISSENNLQFFIPVIATQYIGATMAPLNHNYTLVELRHTLNISKPSIIFSSKAIFEKFLQLRKELKFIKEIVVIDSEDYIQGATTLNKFIVSSFKSLGAPYSFTPFDGDPKTTAAFIMCSSGTTGLPKGVMQSHTNLLTRMMHAKDPRYYPDMPNKILIGIMPFFHGFGLVTALESIVFGKMIIVIKQFEEDLFLRCIEKYRIDSLWLAPPLVVFLAKSPKVLKYDLTYVQEVMCGAAPLSKETETELKKRLPIKFIKQAYGLTESTLAVTGFTTRDERSGSSGQVMPYMKIKVRNPETGKSLGSDQVGEICIKGPMVMLGYYGNEKATRESFTSDGWLLTGDLGHYNKDGHVFVVDRLKELIKYKGFQVAPAELEALLLAHPKIRDVGVVGLPDESAGELPLAFVVKHEGVQLSENEVQEYLAKQVSPQKKLRGGVIFVGAIPKNPSGKILRRELRELLKKHEIKKSKL